MQGADRRDDKEEARGAAPFLQPMMAEPAYFDVEHSRSRLFPPDTHEPTMRPILPFANFKGSRRRKYTHWELVRSYAFDWCVAAKPAVLLVV